MTPARLGAICAVTTFVLDQATKLGLFYGADLAASQPIALTPFLELILVWNTGISYGLFPLGEGAGRWVFVAGSLAAAALLSVWIARARAKLAAAAFGLIAGGAVGNAVDRVLYGAVLDFVHIHVGAFNWYVFNVADAAIVAGVVGLLWESVAGNPRSKEKAPASESET